MCHVMQTKAFVLLLSRWEAASLGFLLRAQQAIAAFAFKDTMTCIYRARLELDQWRTRCTLSDVGAKDKVHIMLLLLISYDVIIG